MKILVIDDDTSMLGFLQLHLEKAGYQVLLAEDGIVGGQLAFNASPNLILVDVDMPYWNGYGLFHALKRTRQHGASPWYFSRLIGGWKKALPSSVPRLASGSR